MRDDGLIAFLADGLEANLAAHASSRGPQQDAGPEEAAYYALENAGLLRRQEPGHRLLADLRNCSRTARSKLVRRGCLFVSGFSLAERVAGVLEREEFDDDALDETEALLVRRDALEAALRFAVDLTDDLLDQDGLRTALLSAREVAAQIDDVLWRRPDVLCVASRILVPAADSPPWLIRVNRLDRLLEEANLTGVLPAPGEDTVTSLLARLRDPAPDIRRAAAEALGAAGDAEAVASLRVLLGDADEAVRRAAAEALGKLGPALFFLIPPEAEGRVTAHLACSDVAETEKRLYERMQSPDGRSEAALCERGDRPRRLALLVDLPAHVGRLLRVEICASTGETRLSRYVGLCQQGERSRGEIILDMLPAQEEAHHSAESHKRRKTGRSSKAEAPQVAAVRYFSLEPVSLEGLPANARRELEASQRATSDPQCRAALADALKRL